MFTLTTFLKEMVPFDLKPGPSETLVQVDWPIIDPWLRIWLGGAYRYLPPPADWHGHAVPRARHGRSGPGDIVSGRSGKSTRRCSFFAVYICG
jgi:hypothetical protein